MIKENAGPIGKFITQKNFPPVPDMGKVHKTPPPILNNDSKLVEVGKEFICRGNPLLVT
jgi:hypothetical protein